MGWGKQLNLAASLPWARLCAWSAGEGRTPEGPLGPKLQVGERQHLWHHLGDSFKPLTSLILGNKQAFRLLEIESCLWPCPAFSEHGQLAERGERTFSTWEAKMLFHWLMSVSSWNEALPGWSEDIVMEGIWWQDVRMNASDFRQRDLHILPRDRKVVCHLWSKFFYLMTANEWFTHSRV